MPYIVPSKREIIDHALDKIVRVHEFDNHMSPITDDVLAGAIYNLVNHYLVPRSYRRFNEIVGMLECCRLELIRKAPESARGGEYYTVISKGNATLPLHDLNYLNLLNEDADNLAGNLNYIITKIILSALASGLYRPTMGPAAVLAFVKDRIYLEQAAPYEDEKEKENGPVTLTKFA